MLSATEVLAQNSDAIARLSAASGLIGVTISLFAVGFAVRSFKIAGDRISQERMRVFQLEVLRQLVVELDESDLVAEVFSNPRELARFRMRLDLLKKNLPNWETVITLKDQREVMDFLGLGDRHDEWLELRLQKRQAEAERTSLRFWEFFKQSITVETLASRIGEIEMAGKRELNSRLVDDVHRAIREQVMAGNEPRLCWRCKAWYRI
ncbi:hypothetical protein GCM10010168_50600 [Actinoplanes ianthinogenes]|uniref:Uncharacterized protein n=1 Tax=Actinoplanes ianthinogenes TaxID=122358 RepID=A0ABM7M383_9ACTN|nr:hypothetical protein [Actinoplanes ianthinogenes]BCJ46111.1 hypothetical protein Aiant_67680 [Actinoplanes ianthinogenes]GGR26310.1 hypothetical protein GCM10010168_50600 [Actinoplanes ianthinogenes]